MLVGTEIEGADKIPSSFETLKYSDIVSIKAISSRKQRKTA
jgi:hypothetical protein